MYKWGVDHAAVLAVKYVAKFYMVQGHEYELLVKHDPEENFSSGPIIHVVRISIVSVNDCSLSSESCSICLFNLFKHFNNYNHYMQRP